MNKRTQTILISILVVMATISGCTKDKEQVVNPSPKEWMYNPTPYLFDPNAPIPYFKVPEFNPTTNEGVAMGKRLYFDKMLSLGGPLEGKSCSSCHIPQSNFSDNQAGISVMPHTNLNWSIHFLWNGAKKGELEDVMLFEIMDFFKANISLFNSDTTYQRMCYQAFGTSEVSEHEMSLAMAQWLRTHLSFNSKLDKYYDGKLELTQIERDGFLLFTTEKGDCFHCHSVPLTTDLLFHNIGLDSVFTEFNQGRYNVTYLSSDLGKFKTPSLRNVAVTAPYMHDGRFQTLEEVIEHYNSGVKHSNSLDPIMTKPGKEYGLQLTEYEKSALVAFLNTLTDLEYLNNKEFEDPFK